MTTSEDQELIDALEREVQSLKRVVAYMTDAMFYLVSMQNQDLAKSKTEIARDIFRRAFLGDHNG
jgi:hypothetical protein